MDAKLHQVSFCSTITTFLGQIIYSTLKKLFVTSRFILYYLVKNVKPDIVMLGKGHGK